jgi:hypothetical protein
MRKSPSIKHRFIVQEKRGERTRGYLSSAWADLLPSFANEFNPPLSSRIDQYERKIESLQEFPELAHLQGLYIEAARSGQLTWDYGSHLN